MARKIHRTIKSAYVTYEYVDVPTSTICTGNEILTDNINSEVKMLRALKRKYNSVSTEVIKITDVEYTTQMYEMLETDFIKNAWIVDNKED